jgi:hypothetical protein
MQRFQTTDLVLASFALYEGQELASLDRSNPDRVAYIFQVDERRWPGLLARFQGGSALVEPGRFFQCQRAAKAAVLDNNLRRAAEVVALARAMAGGEGHYDERHISP